MKATTLMKMLHVAAEEESKCVSTKVACFIVKDGRIISTGLNGTPAGQPNCCDVAVEMGFGVETKSGKVKMIPEKRHVHSAWSSCNEIHAELNAIAFAAKHDGGLQGATMYITHSPCPDCCKTIAQVGISQVVFGEKYDRSPDNWADILIKSNIKVIKLDTIKGKL